MLHDDNRLLKSLLSLYLKMASRGRYVLLVDFVSLALAVYLVMHSELLFSLSRVIPGSFCRPSVYSPFVF